MQHKIDAYNDFSAEYSEKIVAEYERSSDSNGILLRLLEIIGDVSELNVLDAGCGEGYLSRILVEHGAHVMG